MEKKRRLIDANILETAFTNAKRSCKTDLMKSIYSVALKAVNDCPTVDAVEVVHGRWVLTANEEHSNYRWNVTAECSECHHSKGEIYAGFFSGFPKDLARDVVLDCAKNVKLDNYCPNCGAKMDGDKNE
jgi:hypothetical protein